MRNKALYIKYNSIKTKANIAPLLIEKIIITKLVKKLNEISKKNNLFLIKFVFLLFLINDPYERKTYAQFTIAKCANPFVLLKNTFIPLYITTVLVALISPEYKTYNCTTNIII
ncbi:unnamed protein product, partial [marine sediment metagenome]